MVHMKKLGWLAAAVASLALQAPGAYVILNNADQTKIEGTDIRRKMDGTIILTITGGSREFAPNQVLKAAADAPPEMAQAVQAYQAKDFAKVLSAMETVAREKAGLEVDKQARILMARAYIGQGKAGEAVNQFNEITKHYPDGLKDPALGFEYANALLAAKQFEKLATTLDDLVKDAPRSVAAKAQNLRGDMRLSQGQTDAAILDFMRTVVFFGKDSEEAAPEALLKAAQALDAKKDPRAKSLYKRLVEEYKDSPQAKAAAGKA